MAFFLRRHRKVVVVLGITALSLASIFIIFALTRDRGDIGRASPQKLLATNAAARAAAALDTDGDGLKDWEELLYKSDPTNSDSDGDGTTDGAEVKASRDPAKAAPDDFMTPAAAEDPTSPYASFKRNYGTEGNLTRALVEQFIDSESIVPFLQLDASTVGSEKLAAYIAEFTETAPTFSEAAIPDSRIKLSADGSPTAIRDYFNAVAAAYEKRISALPALSRNDIEITSEFLKQQNPKVLARLDPFIAAIKKLRSDIEAVATPAPIILLHKKELWTLDQTLDQLALMRTMRVDDPVYTLVVVGLRRNTQQTALALHEQEIPEWLAAQKIAFAANAKARLIYPIP